MAKMWLVAKEVYRKNVKSWAFFWMIFGPILMMAVIAAIAFFVMRDQSTSSVGNVGVVTEDVRVQQVIEELEDDNVYHFDLSEDQAEAQLADGTLDGYLLAGVEEDIVQAKFYRKNSGKDISVRGMAQALSEVQMAIKVENLDIDQTAVQDLLNAAVHVETIKVKTDQEGQTTEVSADDPLNFIKTGVAYVVCFVIFIFIMNYISIVSQEIAAEKGSRIMEIILSSITPSAHFLGKLLGVGLVILTQLVIYLVLGLIIAYLALLYFRGQLFGGSDQLASLEAGLGMQLTWENLRPFFTQIKPVLYYGLLYAVLGISIYSILAAFLGSLVSKVEDVNKMVTPITLIGVAGFYLAMYALNAPNSPVVKIGSFIPFFTPFVMPFRVANDSVMSNEIWLSVAIVLVFLVLSIWLSVAFYKSNVLVYSEKGLIGTFKQSISIWRNERQANR